MGIVLDSTRMEARLPEDKLVRISQLLHSFSARRSARLVDLQSLIGTLQFACKVVVPGRTFLQRMINLTRGVPSRFHHFRLKINSNGILPCGKFFSPNGTGGPSSLNPLLPPPLTLNCTQMPLAVLGSGGILMGNGSKALAASPPYQQEDGD